MKTKNLFLTIATMLAGMAAMAQTDGFSYQAVIRDTKGELVKSQNIGLQLMIADSAATNVMYKETQTAPTNEYGVLSVTVGGGKAEDSTVFSNIDWTKSAWLHIAIDTDGGTNYSDFGATKIQAVPVALYAARSGNSAQTVSVNNLTPSNDTLFEVKDKDGNVVFAVYPEGVHVYINTDADDSKMRRSGFLVTGRETSKNGDAESHQNDFLTINGEGTTVFVGEGDSKLRRSGFLVTGREASKDGSGNYLSVNDEGTKVFIDNQPEDESKMRRSGFLVTGRETSKDEPTNYLDVTATGTQVHFDNDASKMRRSGFLVTGRDATKGQTDEYMTINTDSTRFYINGGNAKGDFGVASREDGSKADSGNGGFAVSGRNGAKDGAASNLFNIDLSTDAQTLDSVNRVYWYPEKNAFMAGNLKVESPDSVGENSFNAGFQNKAIGEYSQALGYKSVAKGDYTTAIGREARADSDNAYALGNNARATAMNAYALGMNSEASGEGSYAIGEGATASGTGSFAFGRGGKALGWDCEAPKAIGDYSYAIGSGTEAKMVNSIAIGFNSKAEKENALALGFSSTASGGNAVALGWCCEASGGWSTAMGRCSSASKYYSVAIGFHANATAHSEVVVGTYNDETNAPSGTVDSDSPNSRAFVVGSGWESWPGGVQHLRNALVVLRNGDMTVTGNLTYKSASQSSDIRLKKDVQQLDSALDKVLKLRGVSYYWKNADELKAINGKELFGFDDKKHIGVIAQEVEAVVPELVVTGNDGFKSVTYENIAPLLIEAMKEQQAIIDGQQKEIDELKAANSKLQSQIEEILKKLDK